MPLEFQKTEAITFQADCCVLDRFSVVLGLTHRFAYCIDSGV